MVFKNILIVCVGNVCRSPMAEALFRKALIEGHHEDTKVLSAGLHALVGRPPVDHVCQLLSAKGIDTSNYRARPLDGELARTADLILVMENIHKKIIAEQHPSTRGKTFLLGHWDGFEIADPFQKDMDVFLSTLALIEMGVNEWLQKI
jgi:protein-tyrosine phosphatase